MNSKIAFEKLEELADTHPHELRFQIMKSVARNFGNKASWQAFPPLMEELIIDYANDNNVSVLLKAVKAALSSATDSPKTAAERAEILRRLLAAKPKIQRDDLVELAVEYALANGNNPFYVQEIDEYGRAVGVTLPESKRDSCALFARTLKDSGKFERVIVGNNKTRTGQWRLKKFKAQPKPEKS